MNIIGNIGTSLIIELCLISIFCLSLYNKSVYTTLISCSSGGATKIKPYWLFCIIYALILAPGQEILFRYFINGYVIDYLGPIIGITIGSIIFGLLHYYHGMRITILAIIMGLVFSVDYYINQSLLGIIIGHISIGTIRNILRIKHHNN